MIDDTVLLRYLDGELDEETRAAVADQLRRDPALQRRTAELRAVEAAYREALDETLPSHQPDIVEPALERVLDQDGDIEVLRSPASRQALARYGRIGALLRYAYSDDRR